MRALKFYLQIKELERGPDRGFTGSLDIINFVAQMLIWSLLCLVALENLGVNITALLAGLGVGGVAVALALQNVLGDLFASLSIALDKPFVVGDRLVIEPSPAWSSASASRRRACAAMPASRSFCRTPTS